MSYVLPRQALSYLALNKENFLSADGDVLKVVNIKFGKYVHIVHFQNFDCLNISFGSVGDS